MTFNEKMVLKNYDSYIKLVTKAYKEAPDFEQSEKYRWDILNKSNYTFFKRLVSKVEVIFVTTDKSLIDTKIEILGKNYKVEYMANEPYSSQKEMKEAYEKSGVLYISMDYSNHPVFSVIDNIVFRAVHDYIVHILADVDFSGKGEIAAFNAHAKLAPKEAIPAIFTEVCGQACYFITYGNFPKQKIAVLKGFDYTNVGAVEGYDIVNKELVKKERILEYRDYPSNRIEKYIGDKFVKNTQEHSMKNNIKESKEVELKSKSDKGNRNFKMLSTGMFQHYDMPKGELSKLSGGEETRKRIVSKLSKEDKKTYRAWLKTPEGQKSLELFK